MIDIEKEDTKSWLVNSDDSDEEMPDAGSLLKKLGKSDHGQDSVRSDFLLLIPTGLLLSQSNAAISSKPISSQPSFTANTLSSDLEFTNLERWKNPKMPSAKLATLVRMLKSWESTIESAMDKVIIYSQCMALPPKLWPPRY